VKILIDNKQKDYHQMVTIQNDAVCIHDVLDSLLDGLKAFGFSELTVYSAVIEKAEQLMESVDDMDEEEKDDQC
jgi:hypothetical protein